MTKSSIEHLIEQNYSSMAPQLQRAAKYVISAPTEVALYPMRRIAANAKVSPSALQRLAAAIGFKSYNDFRDQFRSKIPGIHGPGRFAVHAEELISSHSAGTVAGQAKMAIVNTLAATSDLFDDDLLRKIEAASKLISSSNKTYIVAFRSAQAVSFYFYYVSRLIKKNVILIEGRKNMLLDELNEIEAGDCMVMICYEPYVVDAITAVEAARSAKARIVALTDSTVGPIAEYAEHVLVSPRMSVSFYQSFVPVMAMIDALTYFMMANEGREAVTRVARSFERLAAQGAYWEKARGSAGPRKR